MLYLYIMNEITLYESTHYDRWKISLPFNPQRRYKNAEQYIEYSDIFNKTAEDLKTRAKEQITQRLKALLEKYDKLPIKRGKI